MWNAANWNHHVKDNILYWHWSPTNGFDMNFPIWGYDEALITYIISSSSPTHPISRDVYERTWVGSAAWKNGRTYYGYVLPLGNYFCGGPLFFEQYTYMGIDPNGLTDDHGIDYLGQVTNHTLINREYCANNPKKFEGYSLDCWGLTAGDHMRGYYAHAPGDDDLGVITPTAAISSMPFTPEFSMSALRNFYENMGDKIWGEFGFIDGFSEHYNWYAMSHLGIDQGPIIVMIENYRSGLIWKLFMNIPEIQEGMKKLGFKSKYFQ